ncbi:MAG: hypothetical protein V3S21_03380 [Xanthomonadales bacterium]
MKNCLKTGLIVIGLLAAWPSVAMANAHPESIDELPPGEKFRQLSLLLLVSGGVKPGLLQSIYVADTNGTDEADLGSASFTLQLDDFQTPLARIVDQESMLDSAAQMFAYTRDNGQEIQLELAEITQTNPILISMVDVNEIAEDAIIIRNAIADAIAYSQVVEQSQGAERLQVFRNQTVHLRNMMEFNIFQEELARSTDQAIIDLGGRLDAYQRMFDDEIDPDLVRRRVDSAKIMNALTGTDFDDQARMRTNEILMMLILMESQVH